MYVLYVGDPEPVPCDLVSSYCYYKPGHWTRPHCGHFDLNIQRRINGSWEMILGLVLTRRVAQLAQGITVASEMRQTVTLQEMTQMARHADYAVFVSSLPDV